MIKPSLVLSSFWVGFWMFLACSSVVWADSYCGTGQTCPSGVYRSNARCIYYCSVENGVCTDGWSDNVSGTCTATSGYGCRNAGSDNCCGFTVNPIVGSCGSCSWKNSLGDNQCTWTPRSVWYDCCPGASGGSWECKVDGGCDCYTTETGSCPVDRNNENGFYFRDWKYNWSNEQGAQQYNGFLSLPPYTVEQTSDNGSKLLPPIPRRGEYAAWCSSQGYRVTLDGYIYIAQAGNYAFKIETGGQYFRANDPGTYGSQAENFGIVIDNADATKMGCTGYGDKTVLDTGSVAYCSKNGDATWVENQNNRWNLTAGWHSIQVWKNHHTGNTGDPDKLRLYWWPPSGSGFVVMTRGLTGEGGGPIIRPCSNPCTPTLPSAPTQLSPVDDARIVPASDTSPLPSVTLSWSAPSSWGNGCPSNNTNYWVCVGSTTARAGETDANRCDIVGTTVPADQLSYVISSGLVEGEDYYWRIKAMNGADNGTSSPIRKFTMPFRASGSVYEDTDPSNPCLGNNYATTNYNGISLRRSTLPNYLSSTTASSFSWLKPYYGNYTFSINAPGYVCRRYGGTCPIINCGSIPLIFSSSIPAYASLNNRFYITRQAAPWWQVVMGDGYAASVGVTTPPGQTLMQNYGSTTNSSGVLMAANTIDTAAAAVGPDDRLWAAQNSPYTTLPREGFAYFVRSFELGVAPVVDTVDDPGDDGVYYLTGDFTTSSFNLPSTVTDSRTYFITGNLTVDTDIIVSQDGFLAFIVRGDGANPGITIAGNVTQVQGVYITDGSITVANMTDDTIVGINRQFEGQGIFVGWGGVSLLRDLDSADPTDDLANNQDPAHLFIYRPDFLIHAPDGFKHASIQWQEIAPGSSSSQPSGTATNDKTSQTICSGKQPFCTGTITCVNGQYTCVNNGDATK